MNKDWIQHIKSLLSAKTYKPNANDWAEMEGLISNVPKLQKSTQSRKWIIFPLLILVLAIPALFIKNMNSRDGNGASRESARDSAAQFLKHSEILEDENHVSGQGPKEPIASFDGRIIPGKKIKGNSTVKPLDLTRNAKSPQILEATRISDIDELDIESVGSISEQNASFEKTFIAPLILKDKGLIHPPSLMENELILSKLDNAIKLKTMAHLYYQGLLMPYRGAVLAGVGLFGEWQREKWGYGMGIQFIQNLEAIEFTEAFVVGKQTTVSTPFSTQIQFVDSNWVIDSIYRGFYIYDTTQVHFSGFSTAVAHDSMIVEQTSFVSYSWMEVPLFMSYQYSYKRFTLRGQGSISLARREEIIKNQDMVFMNNYQSWHFPIGMDLQLGYQMNDKWAILGGLGGRLLFEKGGHNRQTRFHLSLRMTI
jgi:hypothetical protein